MSAQQNKQLVAGFFQAMTDRDFDKIAQFLAPDHQFFFPLSPVPLGPEAHVGMNQGFGVSIADVTWHIEDQLAVDDKVITRGHITGKHVGDFNGLPPTGNQLDVKFINIVQLRDGKNINEWDSLDTLTMMQQLGAVPTPE